MNTKKVMAFALALFAIAGSFALMGADDSDAVTAGQMNVYINDGSEWSEYLGMSGYNALQALQATGKIIVADTDYILEKQNDWGPYTEINENYGAITSIGGLPTSGSTEAWSVLIYDETSEIWVEGISAIGFITPFTDGACPAANVAFYLGSVDDALTAVEDLAFDPLSLIDPTGADYMYTFTLKVSADGYTPIVANGTTVITASGNHTLVAGDLTSDAGITIIGYGSNAYAALKDAVGGSNVIATETPGPYYGWISELFELTTVSSGSNYVYWTQNTASGSYLAFNLGAYSTLSNVPSDSGSSTEDFNQSAFSLEYVLYSYT